MIAKITSGANFYGAAKYNHQKVRAGQAAIIHSQGLRNTNPKAVANSMEKLSTNSRIKQPVFHVSLSFATADKAKLNDEKLVKIAKEYLQKMGYDKQAHIIYRHDDTAHPHIHILSSRVDQSTQQKINDSYERRRSKSITNALERTHGLTIADHQTENHRQISRDIGQAMAKGRPENSAFLNRELEQMNSPVRVRKAGKGLVYYKVDGEGRQLTKPLNSRDFKTTNLTKSALERQFEAHRATRLLVRNEVQKALYSEEKSSPNTFAATLQKRGIQVEFRQGTKGILSAHYRYEDHAYKGSDLGRELSWNKVKTQLELPTLKQVELRENILDALHHRQPVKLSFDGKNIVLNSQHEALKNNLNRLPQQEALEVAKHHNDRLEALDIHRDRMNSKDQKAVLRSLEGDGIDEYLQHLFKRKQAIEQRKLKR